MKKVITLKVLGLALLMVVSISGIQSQDSSNGRFGIRAGGNITKQNFEDGSVSKDPESKFGLD